MTRHDIESQWIDSPRRVTVVQGARGPEVQGVQGVQGSRGPGVRESIPARLLILHDGQNLFDPDRAHRQGHHWRVAETLQQLCDDDVLPPGLVVAGVDHGEQARILEMTPTEGAHPGAGLSWRYGRFLMEELVPLLVRTYGVDVRPGQLALGGSSLGGLATLAVAQQFPGRFGRLLVMSPSVWWDGAVILRRLRRQPLVPSTRVWLDIGHQEGREALHLTRQLRRVLRDQLDTGGVGGLEDEAGDHSEDSWSRRLPDALRWLYG